MYCDDILDFSKIEARKLVLETTAFDLRQVLEDSIAVLAIRASEKKLELTCELEPATPWLLRGDPGRVRQVLVNLLGNAVKFTAQGEVALRVGLETPRLDALKEHAVTLRFTVRDTGVGFRQDRASALFEPFTQADGSSTRRYGGTGLGLTISKQLVELMGGEIGVDSEEGKGSTFWFTVVFEKQIDKQSEVQPQQPSVEGHAPTPVQAEPVAAAFSDDRDSAFAASLKNAKVLVVDASVANQSLVSRLLSSWGLRPGAVADGDSALATLRQAVRGGDSFKVALLDMGLQGMDGEELGRRIASDPQLKQTALVLMTGLGRQHDWARLQALGFTAHVSKPIWGRHLREALLSVDAKGSGLAPSAASACPQPGAVQKKTAHKKSDARILLAEDNLTNQEVAIAMLTKLGYKADLVVNGTETLRALRKADYDVVLMDCGMPEMDGYEATRCIRENQPWTRNPHITIIAITADAMSGDREKCLQTGMNDYLAKPIALRQLADVLEKWLNPLPSGAVDASAAESAARTGTLFNRAVVNQAVFNHESLLARLMGDQGLAGKLIAIFLEDAPQRLLALKDRLAARDACGARLQAHTLKGAAATVSAEALRSVCSEVQEAAASGNILRASAMLPQLQEQFELFQATLKESGWAGPNSQSNARSNS